MVIRDTQCPRDVVDRQFVSTITGRQPPSDPADGRDDQSQRVESLNERQVLARRATEVQPL